MGGYRKSRDTVYSEVDSRHTPITTEDYDTLTGGGSGWGNGYFQTSNSFIINKAIRRSEKERLPLSMTLVQEYENYGYSASEAEQKKDKALKVVEAMDRSMKPLDKDIPVARFTTNKWLRTALQKMGVYDPAWATVSTFSLHDFVRDKIDQINDVLSKNTVTYYDQAFNSATYNLSFSDSAFLGRPVRIEYIGTKGTNVVFSPTDDESEVVFDRKAGLQIERMGWDDHRQQLVIYGRTTKK